jgi:hypothetical protein
LLKGEVMDVDALAPPQAKAVKRPAPSAADLAGIGVWTLLQLLFYPLFLVDVCTLLSVICCCNCIYTGDSLRRSTSVCCEAFQESQG